MNVQQTNEPQRLFIQQPNVNQLHHIQRSPQQIVQHSQVYTKARVIDNYSNTNSEYWFNLPMRWEYKHKNFVYSPDKRLVLEGFTFPILHYFFSSF